MGNDQVHRLAAISPEPHTTEAPTLPAAQVQPAYLTAERRCGAMDLSIIAQAHHSAPAGPSAEPGDQLITGKSTIRQQRDRPETTQEPIGLLEQSDRNRGTDAGTGMLERLPEQRNGPVVNHHGENHDAEAVPEHGGIQSQIQGVAWVLPLLERPEHKRAIQRLNVDATVGQLALTVPLPARGQAMG
jgi:hypothetical protein